MKNNKKIHFEATISVDFVPEWGIENDDDMWEAIGAMGDSICYLVRDNDSSVKSIDISDYDEGYVQ